MSENGGAAGEEESVLHGDKVDPLFCFKLVIALYFPFFLANVLILHGFVLQVHN